MSNNSQETGAISVNDAINSLLTTTPETDKVEEGRLEAEASPPEEELESTAEDNLEAEPEAELEDESDEGEDTEVEEEEEEEEEEPLYTVTIDGEDYEVNLDELRNGYQRQQVFTRRMQEIAKEREAVKFETEQAKQQVQELVAERDDLVNSLQSSMHASKLQVETTRIFQDNSQQQISAIKKQYQDQTNKAQQQMVEASALHSQQVTKLSDRIDKLTKHVNDQADELASTQTSLYLAEARLTLASDY